MNFLDRIKADLNAEQKRRGMREQTVVNARALRELIHHFEQLDSFARATDKGQRHKQLGHILHDDITAMYHQHNQSAETTLLVIMGTLMPLMEQHQKDKECAAVFGG